MTNETTTERPDSAPPPSRAGRIAAAVGAVPASWRWVVFLVYANAITALSLAPSRLLRPPVVAQSDKLLHFLAYAIYAALLCWPLPGGRRARSRPLLGIVTVVAAHGLLLEVLQAHLGGDRFFSGWDALANLAGAAAGAAAMGPRRPAAEGEPA